METYDEGFERCRIKVRLTGESDLIDVEAWRRGNALVVLEQPGFDRDTRSNSLDDDDPCNHNCDWMGCGLCHVMMRIEIEENP